MSSLAPATEVTADTWAAYATPTHPEADMVKTFRDGVLKFWEWFPTVADNFASMLDDQKGEKVVAEVRKNVNKWMPSMCWVFGPEPDGHSFTLTGEGVEAMQLLAEFWLTQAVEVPGWRFYSSKQPSTPEAVGNFSIQVGENLEVDCERFMVATSVDEENERIHLQAWHPTYARLGEEHHMQILFINLDELLGEFGTQTWIGEMKIEPIPESENAKPLIELPAFIKSVSDYHKWEKLSPLETYSVYESPEPQDFPRGDTLFGSTCIQHTLFAMLNEGGKLSEDPCRGAGAEFVYVAVDRSVFPEGQEVEVRANIEETIDESLRKVGSGRSLGGAFGIERCYIDFLLFDGKSSRKIVEEQLKQLQLSSLSTIEPFL